MSAIVIFSYEWQSVLVGWQPLLAFWKNVNLRRVKYCLVHFECEVIYVELKIGKENSMKSFEKVTYVLRNGF